jgi:hypothetical protein
MTVENQKKYDSKLKRLNDALALRTPDKVPIDISGGEFMIQRLGYTVAESNYDETLQIAKEAAQKFMLDFEPDTCTGLGLSYAGEGPGHEMQGCKTLFIAGMKNAPIGPDSMPQFVEFPTLLDDEFDEFRYDYTKWSINKFLPRVSTVMEPFANFTFELSHRGIESFANSFGKPDIRETIKKLWEIDDFYKEYRPKLTKISRELSELGFPSLSGGRAVVPFDKYSDTFRGMVNSFVDIFEEEEFVLGYCEKFQKEQLENLKNLNKDGSRSGKLVAMALHKGSDDMMGNNLYRKFYWNHLKQIIDTCAESGMMTNAFCEGEYNNKLEILCEVEKCAAYFTFDKIDIKKAKETIGKICCIGGGFPSPLLIYASPDKIEEELKRFLDIAMKDGGYIFRLSAGINGAKEENVERMFKVLHEYGKY